MPTTKEKGAAHSLERRAYPFALELRDDQAPAIVGHAAVFNVETQLPWFREMIAAGAFAKTIKEADVRSLFNHDVNFVIGRIKSGTLELEEDSIGLRYNAAPPKTTWANDLLVSMRRGDIDQSSFGFRVIKEEWDTTDQHNPLRIIREVELFDVSPVTFAQYPETDSNVRSFLENLTAPEPPQVGHSEALIAAAARSRHLQLLNYQ